MVLLYLVTDIRYKLIFMQLYKLFIFVFSYNYWLILLAYIFINFYQSFCLTQPILYEFIQLNKLVILWIFI